MNAKRERVGRKRFEASSKRLQMRPRRLRVTSKRFRLNKRRLQVTSKRFGMRFGLDNLHKIVNNLNQKMPQVDVIFYQDDDGGVPVLEWIDSLRRAGLIDKAKARIDLLEQQVHALRRPHGAPLRDKIHELRWEAGKVNYRILYFFNGQNAVVLAHGCTKESEVDSADIDRANRRRARFIADPAGHTCSEDES